MFRRQEKAVRSRATAQPPRHFVEWWTSNVATGTIRRDWHLSTSYVWKYFHWTNGRFISRILDSTMGRI